MAETRANLGAAAPQMEVDDDMPNLLSFNIHGGFEFVLATVALILQELLGKMKMMTLSFYARVTNFLILAYMMTFNMIRLKMISIQENICRGTTLMKMISAQEKTFSVEDDRDKSPRTFVALCCRG
ncbi:uncharacterized protein LOC105174367 isoform X1 [Sesamum indicum]|uniref:Uncharacterized protein LOC105174367 isoform X1 n=1 Tax=Sesamum indicum TaxID=4182 RepID=A0A6I9UK42_SESIN|nr:uncharacterized protein LOC105174367 isoform X1 [Sesamum indicum]